MEKALTVIKTVFEINNKVKKEITNNNCRREMITTSLSLSPWNMIPDIHLCKKQKKIAYIKFWSDLSCQPCLEYYMCTL